MRPRNGLADELISQPIGGVSDYARLGVVKVTDTLVSGFLHTTVALCVDNYLADNSAVNLPIKFTIEFTTSESQRGRVLDMVPLQGSSLDFAESAGSGFCVYIAVKSLPRGEKRRADRDIKKETKKITSSIISFLWSSTSDN